MKKYYLTGLAFLALSFSSCEKGETGPQGDKGATGVQGTKGDAGQDGAAGAMGDKGNPGQNGAAGTQGPKGDKGDTGATGAQGTKGDTGTQGPKGDKGTSGAFSSTYFDTKFSSSTINLLQQTLTDLGDVKLTYIKLQSNITINPENYISLSDKGLVLIYVRDSADSEGIWQLQSSGNFLFSDSGNLTTDQNNYNTKLHFEAFSAKTYVKIVATIEGYLPQNTLESLLRKTSIDIKVVMLPERSATSVRSSRLNLKNYQAVAQSLNLR